jgi:virginiamycin B lyase
MRIIILILIFLILSFGAGITHGNQAAEITEWSVPWESTRPRDPYVDHLNRVWFVGQKGDYLAYLEPNDGRFKRFDLEPGTGPHNLIIDVNGKVWYAGNRKAHIGKLDPATGKITRFSIANPKARDPHTLVFDQKGDIWFTVQWGNFVGKLSTKTGKMLLIPVPTSRARPYGVIIDNRNQPWIAQFGTNKLSTIDPKRIELQEIPLPREDARPRRLALTSDGMIWYVDYAKGFLGRLNTATGKFKGWSAPGGSSERPYGMTADDRNRLWFVECGPQPNRLVGFEPRTQKFFSVSTIGSGGGSVRHMVFHSPSREIWFGTDRNTIGRARVP